MQTWRRYYEYQHVPGVFSVSVSESGEELGGEEEAGGRRGRERKKNTGSRAGFIRHLGLYKLKQLPSESLLSWRRAHHATNVSASPAIWIQSQHLQRGTSCQRCLVLGYTYVYRVYPCVYITFKRLFNGSSLSALNGRSHVCSCTG